VVADTEVVGHTHRIGSVHFDGQCHARIALDVSDLAATHQVTNPDVVTFQTNPHRAYLRTAVRVDGGDMCESARGKGLTDFIGEGHHEREYKQATTVFH
jgi:hypothetical protein